MIRPEPRLADTFDQPPPKPDADVPHQVRWLRYALHAYAGDLAAWELTGALSRYEGECELLLAGIGLAREIAASRDTGITAARAEWKVSSDRAANCINALRRAIWPLGRMLAPTPQILATAERINTVHGVVLPHELLIEQARQITQAAMPKARRKYAKRYA